MASLLLTAILICLLALTLQNDLTYKDIQMRFNVTKENSSKSSRECFIGNMEMTVFDEKNEAVVGGQGKVPYEVNLTLGVTVQNPLNEYADLIYIFESDNDYPVVQLSPLDNWATVRLQQDKKQQRFTVYVEATRRICENNTLHCVGVSWIDFAIDSENSPKITFKHTRDQEEQISKNNLALKMECPPTSLMNSSESSDPKKSEHPNKKETVVKSEKTSKSDVGNVTVEPVHISSAFKFDLTFFLWVFLIIVIAIAIAFLIQMCRNNREEDPNCNENILSDSVDERITVGRGGRSHTYRVNMGNNFKYDLSQVVMVPNNSTPSVDYSPVTTSPSTSNNLVTAQCNVKETSHSRPFANYPSLTYKEFEGVPPNVNLAELSTLLKYNKEHPVIQSD